MTKLSLLTAAAAFAVTATASASAAQAGEVEIRDAVARVVVIAENRSDIEVQIDQGGAGLPALTVRRSGDDVIIDGDLDRRIRNCRSGDFVVNPTAMARGAASAEVRDHGTVDLADAPLIVIRTPMDVEVDSSGAVWGSIGRSSSVELGAGGCGDWSVANTDGPLSISVGGSGDVRAGTADALEVAIGGSGDVRTGAVTSADLAIGGSGDITIASIDGSLDVAIGGSGEIDIRSGRAPSVDAAVAGSGTIRFGGEAGDVDATIVGSGDVIIARVTGRVDRSIMGSGTVRVGE